LTKNIGIGWQLHDRTGWGVYGINLTLQLQRRPGYSPTLLFPTGKLPEHPLQQEMLRPIIEDFNTLTNALMHIPEFKPTSENLTILYGLGNNFTHNDCPLSSNQKAGIIFFENTIFNQTGKDNSSKFPLIITGSHWNEDILRQQNIPSAIETVIQGIDPTFFHPAPKSGLFKNRFVIFSGGKLEYRKGQDIVIAAFKIFQKRHPEALLLAAWHNSWPESMTEIATRKLVTGVPVNDDNQPQAIADWLLKNGLEKDSFLVIPGTPNIYMAPVIREADMALFPNRGEGGTNLVAMETLACGIPVALAANTGQLDFANSQFCYPLTQQETVLPTPNMPGVDGWGESSVEEIVEVMEEIYTNYDQAQKRAQLAAANMQNYTWEKQIDKLLQVLDRFFNQQSK